MRTALVTTTINVPTVLALYRKLGPDVKFFVVGDKKTPQAAYDFCDALPNCVALRETAQTGWKCSELIGWNCIQRRNIGFLEALRWGAEVIISWDDDNLSVDNAYFDYIEYAFLAPYNGIKASGASGWFDVGQLLEPISPHRGFPHQVNPAWRADSVTDAKVGVAAGICLGDPDISAVTRIVNHPTVHRVSELLRAGIVVDNKTWTVFNSQNTAFIRELAPAMLLCPQFKRYDDIVASLVCQRVMREHGYHVHFGPPYTYQQRNEHNLVRDLQDETWGMENIQRIVEHFDAAHYNKGKSVIEIVREIYARGWCPAGVDELANAWLDDCGAVL